MLKRRLKQAPFDGALFKGGGCFYWTSLILKMLDKTLFAGQWAPTILILGLYNKLVKQHGPA
jgi:hypothetical protein